MENILKLSKVWVLGVLTAAAGSLFSPLFRGQSWEGLAPVLYQISGAARTSRHKLGGLKQQNVILTQFWMQKVQNQGVSRALLPLRPVRVFSWSLLSLVWPASLGCSCMAPVSIFVGLWRFPHVPLPSSVRKWVMSHWIKGSLCSSMTSS